MSLTRVANASKSKQSIILQVEARMRELDSSCSGAVADHQEVLIVSGRKLNIMTESANFADLLDEQQMKGHYAS